jgi:two-component system nitrogen regulation response regulator GlnG
MIAATHHPLEQLVDEGKFRQDLFFRLDGFTIRLPALRERKSDIPALTEYFLRRARIEMDRNDLVGVSHDALKILEAHDWPGNVRELQSVVRQSLLNCTTSVITRECLPESMRSRYRQDCPHPIPDQPSTETSSHPAELTIHLPNTGPVSTAGDTPTGNEEGFSIEQFVRQRFEEGSHRLYAELIAEVERRLLLQVLALTDGNQSRASEVLGITRGKIRDRINAFGIKVDTTVTT